MFELFNFNFDSDDCGYADIEPCQRALNDEEMNCILKCLSGYLSNNDNKLHFYSLVMNSENREFAQSWEIFLRRNGYIE